MVVGASLARSAVVAVAGERVGIVGATTPALSSISVTGDISVMLTGRDHIGALADIIQSAVDELADQGINKIVLLAHMQRIDVEQALAGTLENVDIIVAGGSNTLLADETDRFVPVTPQRIHTRCNTSPPTAIRCCWSTPTVITGISDGWSSGSTTWVAS